MTKNAGLHYNALAICAALMSLPAGATTVLYDQGFENPVGFVNAGGDVNIKTVNELYGNQPVGFQFAQQFTVETLLVGGSQAFSQGFKDPQAKAGTYVLGMLSSVQNDLLGLSFDVGSFQFLNFQLDISSIDLSTFGGPFVPTGGQAPKYSLSLYDNPGGGAGLGGGTLLDQVDITGLIAPNQYTFNWTNHTVALDATGNSNGNVTLVIDLLEGGYAAMDNFLIAASDDPGDVGGGDGDGGEVDEPGLVALLGISLLGIAFSQRRRPNQIPRAATR